MRMEVPDRPGRRGSRSLVKRQWVIAVLAASAALALAGVTEASAAVSSPPAPLRVAASPRHPAAGASATVTRATAGASATATHAARSRHGRKHDRRHNGRRAAARAQLIARSPMSAAGGSPPQPAHRSPVNHHAALRPASSGYRHLLRNRTGCHGPEAESPARIAVSTESSRFRLSSSCPETSNDYRVSQGRGPPRAGPDFNPFHLPQHRPHGSTPSPDASPNPNQFVLGQAREPSPPRPPGGRGGVFRLPSIGELS